MAKRNDFMEGFLRGLYNSGVGNPDVQRQNEAQQQQQNAQLTSSMAEKGMLPPDHPAHSKIQDFVGSLVGSVTGAPTTKPLLASQFQKDPNAITMAPSGEMGMGHVGEPGYKVVNDPKLLAGQYKAEMDAWAPLPGVTSKAGNELLYNRKTADTKEIQDTSKTANPRVSATEARTKFYQDMLAYRKVHDVSKATGIQPKVVSTLQTNNMRADRALSRLEQPKMTWQDFNTVVTDWQGIMQGGVPHQMQYADSKFPNWKETTAQWNTYATGHPTENVPPEIQNYMKGVIGGLKDVDNNYLQQNADFVGKTLGSTITGYNKPGGLGETVQKGTQRFLKGGVSQQPSNLSYSDPDKEKRYQEWLKTQR